MKKSKKIFTVEQKDYRFKRDRSVYLIYQQKLKILKGVYCQVSLHKKWKCLRICTMTLLTILDKRNR